MTKPKKFEKANFEFGRLSAVVGLFVALAVLGWVLTFGIADRNAGVVTAEYGGTTSLRFDTTPVAANNMAN